MVTCGLIQTTCQLKRRLNVWSQVFGLILTRSQIDAVDLDHIKRLIDALGT